MSAKNFVAVAQSGGPTAAINASLLGVIRGALSEKAGGVLGAVNGITGVLNDNFIDLKETFASDEARHLLKTTPAAYLGSCRHKMPDINSGEGEYERIFEVFKKRGISAFLYIGGNDSMDTVHKLSAYARAGDIPMSFIGIPKTIDNDLAVTDHCPGYGSAAKYIGAIVRETARDCEVYNTKSVTVIEIMGRNAGWLTAAAALAREKEGGAPHLIYLPETSFSMDGFLSDIKSLTAQNIVVAVSEGIRDKNGAYICEDASSGLSDIFGHKYLSGAGKVLERAVHEELGYKARAIELNTPQRSAAHIASLTDINEAEEIGRAGVCAALSGETGKMMVFERTGDYAIEIRSALTEKIANAEKKVPPGYIRGNNDITPEFLKYARPLIQGETRTVFENGLPKHIFR